MGSPVSQRSVHIQLSGAGLRLGLTAQQAPIIGSARLANGTGGRHGAGQRQAREHQEAVLHGGWTSSRTSPR